MSGFLSRFALAFNEALVENERTAAELAQMASKRANSSRGTLRNGKAHTNDFESQAPGGVRYNHNLPFEERT